MPNIVAMNARHVAEVARIHRRLLHGLLTDLGPHAISYFYKTALEIDGTHAWVALDEEERIVGFVLGTESGPDLYDRVFRRRPIHGIGCVAADLFSRPAAVATIAWWFLKGRPAGTAFEAPELVYLAVDPVGRGGGSARLLFNEISKAFHDNGLARFQLSVNSDNVPGQRFFEKMGGERIGTYEEGGIRRIRYAFRSGS